MYKDIAKLSLIICLAAALPTFAIYMALVEGEVYVKRVGWQTYEQAPFTFTLVIFMSSITLIGIALLVALLVWLGRGRQKPQRTKAPMIDDEPKS